MVVMAAAALHCRHRSYCRSHCPASFASRIHHPSTATSSRLSPFLAKPDGSDQHAHPLWAKPHPASGVVTVTAAQHSHITAPPRPSLQPPARQDFRPPSLMATSLLPGYSDSDSDADSPAPPPANSLKRKRAQDGQDAKPQLPPLPATFHDLYTTNARVSTSDDPSLHSGRKRAVPHIDGNWPTHVYLECMPAAR